MQEQWFTDTIRYDSRKGYVMLQLPPLELSPFSYEGIAYEPKQELHCSFLCVQELAEYFDDPVAADAIVTKFVKDFVQTHPLEFGGYTKHVYVCSKDDIKSIVIGAVVAGIDQLYHALRDAFDELKQLDAPALHVTLYKYNHQYGIGIQSEAQLRELCRPIPFDVLPPEVREKL